MIVTNERFKWMALLDYWTLIYVRFWKLWTIAHWFYTNYVNKFISFCYLSLGMPFGSAVFIRLCFFFDSSSTVLRFCRLNPFLQYCFHFYTHSDGWRFFPIFFLFIVFEGKCAPYTFECTQTSGYHFIILFVTFSVCGIVYQLSVLQLLFMWLNTLTYEVGFVTGCDFG